MSEEKKLDEKALEGVTGGGGSVPRPISPDAIPPFKRTFCPNNCDRCRNQSPSQCYYQEEGANGAFWAGLDAHGVCPGFAAR